MKWLLIVSKIVTKLDKIKVTIEFSNQLSQDNWYLTLATKVLVTNYLT